MLAILTISCIFSIEILTINDLQQGTHQYIVTQPFELPTLGVVSRKKMLLCSTAVELFMVRKNIEIILILHSMFVD